MKNSETTGKRTATKKRRRVPSLVAAAAFVQAGAAGAQPAADVTGDWAGVITSDDGVQRSALLSIDTQSGHRLGGALCVGPLDQAPNRCGGVIGAAGKKGAIRLRLVDSQGTPIRGALEASGTTMRLSSPLEWFADCYLVKVEP